MPVSLAKRHQKMECCNFINNQLTPGSHPLFANEKKVLCHKLMEDNEIADIQIKFQRSGFLPGVTLKSVYTNIRAKQYLAMIPILQHCYQSLEK